MCGIAGAVSLDGAPVPALSNALHVMSALLAHRGPDGAGFWRHPEQIAGLAHRRLAVIDTTPSGKQPMSAPGGRTVISYNGEIYNYRELKQELASRWTFQTSSDTETIMAAHESWSEHCLSRLRGMFAFALWDGEKLFAARDRFGIKPFYYAVIDGTLYFASEIKALLPLLPGIETDPSALAEYLTFQYTLGDQTLFKHVKSLPAGHYLVAGRAGVEVRRYWDVRYDLDRDHTPRWFTRRIDELMNDSIQAHMVSDVPVGAYVSGGIDSSLMAQLSASHPNSARIGFHGKFSAYPGYDESAFAEIAATRAGIRLEQADMTASDFADNIGKVIYHLDTPVGGPGSFPQFMVARRAAEHVKVVLGGQGGDEVFGGYARYLIAYLEQSLKASIDGTYRNGNFVVTPESILPHLTALQEYKPLIQTLFSQGLFGALDDRYLRLIDRSSDMTNEVEWGQLDRSGVIERYKAIFNSERNVRKTAYFDAMTHFDFKCLLPALLQVEDRMSMAHGVESRVPFLDHPIIEFAATIPADIKFKGGRMKHFLKSAFAGSLPTEIVERRDKMGFPVPLNEWFAGPLRDFIGDAFTTQKNRRRPYFNSSAILANFDRAAQFSRKTWGLLSLELWHQTFHDQAASLRRRLDETPDLKELS